MAVPLATTTITVVGVRPESDQDADGEGYPGYVAPVPATIASGVRASITNLRMTRERRAHGEDGEHVSRRMLLCDWVDLREFDRVTDDTTGQEYEVETVDEVETSGDMFGLDHVKAILKYERSA